MSQLSGLDDEEADISDQGARDRDTQKKQANKDYVDKMLHAKERDVREGDLVLLEQKRQNKLSSSYEKEPYGVMTRYGDQVVLRSSNGGEYRRNMQHIKPFNIPDHERAASQSELGSACASAASASATQVMAPVTPITPVTHYSTSTGSSGNTPWGPSFGCWTATPSKEIWKGYQTTKNFEQLCFVLSLVFFERLKSFYWTQLYLYCHLARIWLIAFLYSRIV